MDQSEQAATASESIDSLAAFLTDNPNADGSGPENEEKPQSAEAPADEADKAEESTDDSENEATDPDTDEDDAPEKAADSDEVKPSLRFKVTIKGEDGAEIVEEVDQTELVAGYQRRADYTRKTQELGNREREVAQAMATRLQEGQQHYLQQAQAAKHAIVQLAGLKTSEEMTQLAVTDPSAWVQEQQRQTAISNALASIDQGMQAEQAKQQAAVNEAKAKAYAETWQVLTKEGIDKPGLKKIFDTMMTRYHVPAERIANIDSPILVRIMRDAAAYQELQDRKQIVTKKVAEAPRLPAQRQTVPKNEQLDKRINARFRNGGAKLDDLAAYLSVKNL